MKYINEKSNRGIVNLFSDYLLKELTKENNIDAVIEVTDCGKFFIVNGLTNSNKILDMTKLKSSFLEEYKELLSEFGYTQINIIDVITYGQELVKKSEYTYNFYDSVRPIYSQSIIDYVSNDTQGLKYHSISDTNGLTLELDYSEENTKDLTTFNYSPLNITSEFPHGYSLDMGRLEFYYSEYIANHLFCHSITDKIQFKYSNIKNNDDDYMININTTSVHNNESIVSMVLDVFDFDMLKFKSTIKSYDIIGDLTKPFDKKPWLIKDRIKDLVIF